MAKRVDSRISKLGVHILVLASGRRGKPGSLWGLTKAELYSQKDEGYSAAL